MAGERVLIADDEADVLDMCAKALSAEGYQVSRARSGLEAVEMAKQQDFELLITDIRMPGMSGLEAYRAIKQLDPDIAGVAITGYGAVAMVITALKLGMDDFLLKPFSLGDLSAAVSNALTRKGLEKENARLKALIPLFQLSQTFVTVTDLDTLLQGIMQVAVQATLADLGVLMLENEASESLEVRAIVTKSGAQLPGQEYRLSDTITRQATEDGQPVIWQESSVERFFAQETISHQVTTAVALPLITKGEVIGTLGLGKGRAEEPFARSDLELLSVLASQAAAAIQNARLFSRIRSAYEQLKELDRMKSEFLSTVSHELRAPLHSIGGFMQLLLDDKVEDRATQREALETVARQTERLTRLINNLLDVSRMESGWLKLEKGPVQIRDVVREVVAEVRPMAEGRQIALVDDTAPELPIVFADHERLAQVIRNLMHNAIKFTPSGGRIVISAAESEGNLVISVEDDGAGISGEAMPHLFERFYQADSSDTRRAGGTGLGLYICRQIVIAHGGSIWAESEVGKGSTFHLGVPI
ncbi:MAG TPA: ATP-binding protein [Anaerolineae bacterium]|nr:ATP-binding protein [Anaerolineae bacterium]